MAGATVAVNLTMDADVRIAYSTDPGLASPSYSSSTPTTNHRAKVTLSGLSAGTTYYYGVEIDSTLDTGTIGRFTTLDSTDTSLLVALGGDSDTASNHAVFDAIRLEAPQMFLHLGDLHYQDITGDNYYRHLAAFDSTLGQAKPYQLYREVPTVYVWDDHDFAGGDSFGTSAARNAAIRAYRRFVPSYTLEAAGATDPVYHSFEVTLDGIGIVFIVTDQRSAASDKAATDNSSKTMLGTTQKTWFKGLFSDAGNDGKLFVWICTRVFGGAATAGADHWGGFTTERTELCDHIQTEASGRVIVLSADGHFVAIDDGTNHDFVTAGSEPIPCFQCAPLDRPGFTYGGGTYSEGAEVTNTGQYGLMTITKTGASQLTVDWEGKLHDGTSLVTHQMVFNL